MWSYYGSKSKVIDLYPAPKHQKIIEPFAGSARYALKYWEHDVLLVDKYPAIIRVWEYLKRVTPKEIMNLPEPEYKKSIKDYKLSEDEELLMGFIVGQGAASPQYIIQKFLSEPGEINREKKKIADQLHKIKHWTIRLGSYDELENETATWFIDPPYQFGGEHYKMNNKQMDYSCLAKWCISRNGQAIVCENTKANWLPFYPIGANSGAYSRTTEAVWMNDLHQERLSI